MAEGLTLSRRRFLQSLVGAIVVVPSLKPRLPGFAPTPKGWEYKITEVDDLGPFPGGRRGLGVRAHAHRHNGVLVLDRMGNFGLLISTMYTEGVTTRAAALERCSKQIAVLLGDVEPEARMVKG